MNLNRLKPVLFKLHRWVGIVLAPLFLLIVLSGAVLAFKPILEQTTPTGVDSVSAARVIKLLQRIDPMGENVAAVSHEGTWAGSFSGVINLIGASAMSLLILSGSLSWLRGRRSMRARRVLAAV
ncbi:MAG: PepSY domain-containing protein [Candidatus Thiodiazotropha sp.]